MTLANPYAAQRNAYGRDAILTASPARILTMLYDRLVLDLERAELAQREQRWQYASEQLVHAQEIVTNLSSSMRVDVWDGAKDLLALYSYLHSSLVNANIHRDVKMVTECLELVRPLREAWHVAANETSAAPAQVMVGGTLGVA